MQRKTCYTEKLNTFWEEKKPENNFTESTKN